ncbi:MAG: TrkH family potassium uptake protein [Cyclobacteriaceae bacterium]|nr:TrkH family potassium uptake protein [Cyclobacteriaceae bacterium]
MRFNIRLILSLHGILLMLNGLFMLTCLPVSLYYEDNDWKTFFISGLFTILIGLSLYLSFKDTQNKTLRKRDGFLIVTSGWIIMSLFGSFPYLLSGNIPNFTNAFFETISGYTTTGASIMNDIEGMDKSILLWRSLTQWIGGMGIIVLTVAILPMLGIGGMQLFIAEVPGVTYDKIKPRITDTAKRLWAIYLLLTLLECVLLYFAGMSLFDAVNHSLTTMATGGFSTKQDSIAHFNSPLIEYIIVIFMFLAGTNFTLMYFGLHLDFKKVWSNEEFRWYLKFILLLAIVLTFFVQHVTGNSWEQSFRENVFQIVSIVTTTGYASADFTTWGSFLTLIFFIFMFIGGSAGSTAGGIKIVRHIILIKNSLLEIKRQLHPSAIIPVRLNKKAIRQEITFNVLAFIMIYFIIFAFGSVLISMMGVDFMSSVGAVATSLGNVGPGLGIVGPSESFSEIPMMAKWLLSLLMLLGRLELFTILMMFSPHFWLNK